jgi:glycosyltransferase involved in cell wall biosynthesis
VIIPAFWKQKHRKVAAIKNEYPAFDLLVVNDGSTDETSKLAKITCG